MGEPARKLQPDEDQPSRRRRKPRGRVLRLPTAEIARAEIVLTAEERWLLRAIMDCYC